jgi:hypothetical protein
MTSISRVLSEGSQIVDYFDEEREQFERKKLKVASKQEVDPDLFKEGLSCLGKTTNGSNHAYLTLNISQRDLSSIVGIARFRFLQNVDVSGNNLLNLKQLSALKHLVRLNASNNNLKKTFDFDPPANLEWVDYSAN